MRVIRDKKGRGMKVQDEGVEGVGSEPEIFTPKSIPAEDLHSCPYCAVKLEACIQLAHARYQIQCSCGTSGPVEKTLKASVQGWNTIPRGRPPLYEQIRNRSLHLIDEALKVYEEALTTHTLTDKDCMAISHMLEAATMAVDTWEL